MKKAILLCLLTLAGVAQSLWAQTTVNNVTTETQLNNAIANGANIVLGNNITLTNRVVIDAEVTVSIDLNGCELS